MKKAPIAKKKPRPLERRDPTDDKGEYETGCYYAESNNMALCAGSDSRWYEVALKHCQAWTEHVRGLVMPSAVAGESMRLPAFAWLLANCGDLYDLAFQASCETKVDDEAKRDWFCWLYRWMREYSIEMFDQTPHGK